MANNISNIESSSIIDLGEAQSFDLSSYENYENFTIDNFICEFPEINTGYRAQCGTSGSFNTSMVTGVAETKLVKSYDNITGKLTAYFQITAWPATYSGYTGDYKTNKFNTHTMLLL